jgi:hypothetical protein
MSHQLKVNVQLCHDAKVPSPEGLQPQSAVADSVLR